MDQTEVFLGRVLPWGIFPEAFRNIHFEFLKDGNPTWPGDACKTLAEAMEAFRRRGRHQTGLYISPGLQPNFRLRPNGSVAAVRRKELAIASHSFHLDIDVKPGAYTTTRDALLGLQALLARTGLPKPTLIVSSGGGGIHVWWITDQMIPALEWKPIAESLSRAATEAGVFHDSNVSNDITHLMRIPGSFNYKYTPARLCTLLGPVNPSNVPLAAFKLALAAQMPTNVLAFPQRGPTILPEQSEFSANLDRPAAAVPMAKLEEACPLIKQTLDDGGLHHSGGGIWPLMVLAATFIENGHEWVHDLSHAHPEYDPDRTNAKYQEKVQARAASPALGWPTCTALHAAFPGGACNGCPQRNKGKSPFHFTDKQSPHVLELPQSYYQNHNGVFQRVHVEGEDEPKIIPVTTYQVADAWLDRNPEGHMQINFRALRGHTVMGTVSVTPARISAQNISQLLGQQDFVVSPHESKPILGFLMAWLKQLQETTGAGNHVPALGWAGAESGKPKGFSYNNILYTPTGQERAGRSDVGLLAPWTPAGTLAAWKVTAQFITDQKRPALDAILAGAFAGPLVRFTGHRGLLASAYSTETGIGKSTALYVAAAVWGNPTDSTQALKDTVNSSMRRLGAIKNLPLFWDEVRVDQNDKTNSLNDLIFTLTTGREKTRARADMTLQTSGKWQTLLLTASNQSVLETAREATQGTDAGEVRVFEWRVPPATSTMASSQASRISGAVLANYGGAGQVYAEWLGANADKAERVVAQLSDKLNKDLNATVDERFWVSSIAVILAGALLAKNLQLVDFDLAILKAFCLDTLRQLRQNRAQAPKVGTDTPDRVIQLLGDYLQNRSAEHTLTTTRNQKPPVAVQVVAGAVHLKTLDVQVDLTGQELVLRLQPFGEWLRTQNLQRKSVIEGFTRHMQATLDKRVLGAYTHYSTNVPHNILVIPFASLQAHGVVF